MLPEATRCGAKRARICLRFAFSFERIELENADDAACDNAQHAEECPIARRCARIGLT